MSTPLESTPDHALLIQIARTHLKWFREAGDNADRIDQIDQVLAAYEALAEAVAAPPAPAASGTTIGDRAELDATMKARNAAGYDHCTLADTITGIADELRDTRRSADIDRPVITKVGDSTHIEILAGKYTFVIDRNDYLEDILWRGKPWFAPSLRDDQIIFNYAIGPLVALVANLAAALPEPSA